jgi:hypothetical protein
VRGAERKGNRQGARVYSSRLRRNVEIECEDVEGAKRFAGFASMRLRAG